jgi:hypothetical protein
MKRYNPSGDIARLLDSILGSITSDTIHQRITKAQAGSVTLRGKTQHKRQKNRPDSLNRRRGQ